MSEYPLNFRTTSLHSIICRHFGQEPLIGTYSPGSTKRLPKQIRWQLNEHPIFTHATQSDWDTNWRQIWHFTGESKRPALWEQVDFFSFFSTTCPWRISMWLGGNFWTWNQTNQRLNTGNWNFKITSNYDTKIPTYNTDWLDCTFFLNIYNNIRNQNTFALSFENRKTKGYWPRLGIS